jgi:MFS family permease
MVVPFMTLYITQSLHFGIAKAGLVMAIFGMGAICGGFLGGRLTDKFGFYNWDQLKTEGYILAMVKFKFNMQFDIKFDVLKIIDNELKTVFSWSKNGWLPYVPGAKMSLLLIVGDRVYFVSTIDFTKMIKVAKDKFEIDLQDVTDKVAEPEGLKKVIQM